jgi:hypothetical protein
VAVATRLYRKAIDSYLAGEFQLPQREMEEIEVVFNREFTQGLISGESDIVSPEKPMNRGALLGTIENGRIVLKRPVALGDGVGIWQRETVSGAIIQQIEKGDQKVEQAAAGERVDLKIGAREGAKIYLTSSPRIKIEPDFKLSRAPLRSAPRKGVQAVLPHVNKLKAPPLLRFLAKAYSLAEAREIAKAGADLVFYDIFAADFPESGEWQERTTLGAYLPRILTDLELSRS